MLTSWRLLVSHALLVAGSAAAPWALGAGPSSEFAVGGAVQSPSTYRLADLQALTATTQTVSFSAGGGAPQTRTYTGTSLWGVVSAAGILTQPTPRNDLLSKVVTTVGSDGYTVVFAAGELSPDFGNRPSLVAYAETVAGVSVPLGADGFARITAPGDARGGRYVSNLVDVRVEASTSTQGGTGGGASTQFSVGGAVKQNLVFDLPSLQALPAIDRVVGGVTYTGVSFWDLLDTTVGLALDPLVRNDVLGKYVVATGSDGYRAAFSLGELEPGFGNQPDLIAYAADGVPLGADRGFARIVAPNDVRGGRWVSNLVALEVLSVSPVPEPASVVLWALGLVGVGVVSRRSAQRLEDGRPLR